MTRITKAKARKMFNKGITITVIPHKVTVCGMCPVMELQKDDVGNSLQGFDWWIDRYTAHNCNFENGYYVAYYVEN